MDPAVDPCHDFYAYACGGWVQQNPVPSAGKTIMVRAFDRARDDVRNKLYLLLQNAAADQPQGSAIGDLTPGQLFFVAYAQNFCESGCPDALAYQYSRTWYTYAPNRFRAIGPLVNSPEFADAFQCSLGSPMNPVKKCEIW